jgi:hypothetical protein
MHTDEISNANTTDAARGTRSVSWWARVAGAAVTSAVVVTSVILPVGTASSVEAGDADSGSGTVVETAAQARTFSRHVASFPDEIGPHVGGVAARVRIDDEAVVPGELFALFATNGSHAKTRLYDDTAYALVRTDVHPDMEASNNTAAAVVAEIMGEDIAPLEFTSAPAGGFSAGLTFAIGYLNVMSGGAFTDDVAVASTGTLDADGYVDWVTAIDEKTAAAHMAGVDVMFTSAAPAFFTVDTYAARFEGDLHGARRTGVELASERDWGGYEELGAGRPTSGMDIVAVAHLGDVAAYLCGAGSDFACDVRAAMADITIGSLATATQQAATAEQVPTGSANSVAPVGGAAIR